MARESIGAAYIRVLADGSMLPKSIKDEFDKNDDVFRTSGGNNATAYRKGFEEEMEKHGELSEDIANRIREGFGRAAADRNLFGDDFQSNLKLAIERGLVSNLDDPDVRRHAQEIGDRINADIIEGINRGSIPNFSGNNLQRMIAKALSDIQRDEKAFEANWRRGMESVSKDASTNLGKTTDDLIRTQQRVASVLGDIHRGYELIGKDIKGFTLDQDEFTRKFRASMDSVDSDVNKVHGSIDRLGSLIGDVKSDIIAGEAEVKRFSDVWEVYGTKIERKALSIRRSHQLLLTGESQLATTIDKLFGRGSRNNFFNFTGVVAGGIAKVVDILIPFNRGLGTLGAKMGEIWGGNGSIFAKAGSSLAALTPEVGAVIAVLAVLATAIGAVTSAVSGLIAALVSLVSTISFSVVGALAALGPLLAAGIAGFGGLTVAITDFVNQRQQWKAFTNGIAKDWAPIRKILDSTLFPAFRATLPAIQRVFKEIAPFAQQFANGLANAVRITSDWVKSNSFRLFVTAFGDFLPGAIEDLTSVATNFGRIITGVLRASIPSAQSFLGWLDKITDSFADWINSRSGQHWLKNFFDEAKDSAKKVVSFVSTLASLVGELLDRGRSSGDSIFSSLTSSIQDLVDFIQQHPTAVKDWFANGVDTIRHVGDLLESIVLAFAHLDTPANRRLAQQLLEGFSGLIVVLGAAVRVLSRVTDSIVAINKIALYPIIKGIGLVVDALGGWQNIQQNLSRGWDAFVQASKEALDKVKQGFVTAGNAIVRAWGATVSGIKTAIRSVVAAAKATWNSLTSAWRAVTSSISHAWTATMSGVKQAASGAVSTIKSIINGITGTWRAVTGGISRTWSSTMSSLKHAVSTTVNDIGSLFSSLPGKIGHWLDALVQEFTGLAGRILHAIGTIDIGSLISWGSVPGWLHGAASFLHIPGFAKGGIFTGPQVVQVGEAGTEAVVPLDRPLSMINPDVRWLAALAQGKATQGLTRHVDVGGITVVTPTQNPKAVATEVMNQLVGRASL